MEKALGEVSDADSDSISQVSESEWVDNTETLRAKWMLDGCCSLDEVCKRLQEQGVQTVAGCRLGAHR